MPQDKKLPLITTLFSQQVRDFHEKYDILCKGLHEVTKKTQAIVEKIASFEADNVAERQYQTNFSARLDNLAEKIDAEETRLDKLNKQIDKLFAEIETEEAAHKREKRIKVAKKSNVTTPRSLSGTTSSFFGSTISSRNKLATESRDSSLTASQKQRKRGH